MKYPRTYHLPWSPGITNDDKVLSSVDPLLKTEIIITEKMDGGNACLVKDMVYARTHSSKALHPSFNWLKRKHAEGAYLIPEGISVFGENMYAMHSIYYDQLKSYFYIFGVYDSINKKWYSWNDVINFAAKLNFPHVPVLWEGMILNGSELHKLVDDLMNNESKIGSKKEGLVIRNSRDFTNEEFKQNVAKWVRNDHVQTSDNWYHDQIKRNKLKSE